MPSKIEKAKVKRWNKRLDTIRDVVQDTCFGGMSTYTKSHPPGFVSNAEYRNRKKKKR